MKSYSDSSIADLINREYKKVSLTKILAAKIMDTFSYTFYKLGLIKNYTSMEGKIMEGIINRSNIVSKLSKLKQK